MPSRVIRLTFLACLFAHVARADTPPLGAPPPDVAVLVTAPKPSEDVPKIEAPSRETTVTLSAGGQLSTGNSRLVAGTANGKLNFRYGSDGFGASLLANYGESRSPQQQTWQETTENLQARLRYDRYVGDKLGFFLLGTGLHDRFLGLAWRVNLDPGVKYLFVHSAATSLWAEAGYDFQYDIRTEAGRAPKSSSGMVLVDANGNALPLLDATFADNSGRAFVGLKHAFNKEVTVTTGFEFLQSFVDATRYRFDYEALVAANVGEGLSLGIGFTARYDHAPLPGVHDLDTATTINLIYGLNYASKPEAPPPAPTLVPCVPAPAASSAAPAPETSPPVPPSMPPPATAPVTVPPAVSPPTEAPGTAPLPGTGATPPAR